MRGGMRKDYSWTIRSWNGGWWCFQRALGDASASTVRRELESYRGIAGGKYRAFIERIWSPDRTADWRSDDRHGYARKVYG